MVEVCSSSEEHIVEDTEVKVKNVCYRPHHGYCKNCERTCYPEETERVIQPKIRIGPMARTLAGYFRYLNIAFRKTKKIFQDAFGLEISHPTLLSFDKEI